jgi:hypothetical protein
MKSRLYKNFLEFIWFENGDIDIFSKNDIILYIGCYI